MASLRDTVKEYQDDLRSGIAWLAFWREGRSWHGEAFHLDMSGYLYPGDKMRLAEIQTADPKAVVVNGYYSGYLGEEMSVDELSAGVRHHYENGLSNIAPFMEAHDDVLPPEVLEEARAKAHEAGLPFYERPYNDEDIDPYVYDGNMSVEDYELMHRLMEQDNERSDRVNEVFSIQLHNRQLYEQGKDGVWLDMPTTTEQLQAALRQIGISADNPQDFFINGYSYPEGQRLALPYDMVLAADVDELNFLAARLGQLDAAEIAELNAALQNPKGGFASIGQIIDFTENADYYAHLPDVHTAAALGDYYLNRSGMVDMPQEWKSGIDTAQFGRHIAQQEQGAFTEYGYIVKSGDKWQRVHEGQPVPEEYRVMAFPQPEVMRDEIKTRQAAVLTAEAPQFQPVIPIDLNGKNNAERMKEITDRLEAGIQALFESEQYKAYLTAMSKFHNYSFNNTLLIAMQKPDASLVAGFGKWRDDFERHVKKGEKGIKILAPSPYKVKKQMEKIDPATQNPVIGADGKPVTEEREIEIPGFRVVTVFDVSQTEAPSLDLTAEPVVTVLWSESPHLKEGQTMPLHEADALFAKLDAEYPAGMGYDKTKFRIDFTFRGQPDNYEGRQDFGDRDGSLIEHIQSYHEYYAQDESWKNHVIAETGLEGWEQDKAERDMLLSEFVPYMKLHCNLSHMEQEARRSLLSGEELTPEQTAYFHAVLDYVQECRPLLNQGQYRLPEPPKLSDFDQTLQDYKEQVQAEIAQEAAAAGMTVEEYAAAGYEALEQDSFSIYQIKSGDETRDYRFEPFDRLLTTGHSVDRANYDLVYTAPLDSKTTLEDIYRTFNIDHPADFKGHSLSVSDVVVLHQGGKDIAHYCDSFGFQQVPEFLQENPLRTAELSTEQNENMIDGVINNTPSMGELEAKVKAGEQISLTDLADAAKAEAKKPKAKQSRKTQQKKLSIRAQLKAAQEKQAKKKPAREKSQELEV